MKEMHDTQDTKEMQELEHRIRKTKIVFAIITLVIVLILGSVFTALAIVDAGEGERNCTICGRIVKEDITHCKGDEIDPLEYNNHE